ncbi:DUF6958 family protein [Roseobacteraceae bacterium S113]
MSARVACRTPAAGRNGVTNIPLWKFEALREAILAVLAEGDLEQAELTGQVDALLSAETKAELGKLGWHVVTVRLELEVRGEVRRKSERPVVIGLA